MNLLKTPLLLLGVVLLTGTAWSQPTLVNPIAQLEGSLSNPDDEEMAFHWDVTNETDAEMQLMLTRNIVQLVQPFNLPYTQGAAGAYERFCWGPLCYDFGSQTSNAANDALLVTLAPGETDTTFVGDYYPNDVAGVTALEYCFHPPGEPELAACQTVLICVDAAACALSTDEVALGPEWGWRFSSSVPADDRVAMEYTLFPGSPATFELRDMQGALVKTVTLNGASGVMWLGTAGLAEGMYLGTIQQDGVSETAKLVVAH